MSDARSDLGYTGKRSVSHLVEQPAQQELGADVKACARCGDTTSLLVHDPRSRNPQRTICGACQGKINGGAR